MKSYENGTETYCVYLAPADMSGYNVCPNSKHCKELCLNGSGHNKIEILARGEEKSHINQARIKKTKFFFEHKEEFMELLIQEIQSAKNKAEKDGKAFSVRLNGTSDLNPMLFTYMGRNILEIFPNVQFYDYTKVPNHFGVAKRYPNYDITFSFNGYNWITCENYLKSGGKVAVVFDGKLPTEFKGYRVIDANEYDMRYIDPKSTIMGLTYHRVGRDYVNGKYHRPESKFVIKMDD